MTRYIAAAFFIGAAIMPFKSKAQPAGSNPVKPKSPPVTNAAGLAVYMESCVTCHQPDGGGVGNLNPPLINTEYVTGDKNRLIYIILNGMNGQEVDGEMYSNAMPAFGHLTNKQIADVLTYVRSSFGNNAGAVKADEVKKQRAKLAAVKK